MKAVTDSGPTQKNQEKPEAIQNIFSLLKIVSKEDTIKLFDDQYNDTTIRYSELKQQLGEDMVKYTTPIRERIKELSADEDHIKKVVKMGAEKAHESGNNTLKLVKEAIGIKKLY